MKNPSILSCFLGVLFLYSCSKNNNALEDAANSNFTNSSMNLETTFSGNGTMVSRDVPIVKSKEDVIALHLDQQFNLSESVYNEFIESLVFENSKFLGAIYEGVESEMDTVSSNQFWSNFGFSLREQKPPAIFEGYKPKRGGCVTRNRWICVIRDY